MTGNASEFFGGAPGRSGRLCKSGRNAVQEIGMQEKWNARAEAQHAEKNKKVSFKFKFKFFRCCRGEVTRHRALWCSDFPPPALTTGSDPPPDRNQKRSEKVDAASEHPICFKTTRILLYAGHDGNCSWRLPRSPKAIRERKYLTLSSLLLRTLTNEIKLMAALSRISMSNGLWVEVNSFCAS